MTPKQKKITATLTAAIVGPLLVLAISAYVRDEVGLRTRVTTLEAARVTDSLSRADSRAILTRIDQRVTEMYCGSVPQASRAGCR